MKAIGARLSLALWLLFGPVEAFAQSPCEGRIKDKLNHPMDLRFPKPAPGESYVDPAFGTRITRITNPDPAEGKKAIIKTLYNTMRGWNADGSLILLWNRGPKRKYELYEGDAPYRHLRTVTFTDSHTFPADIEEVIWDPVDPLAFYYPSGCARSSQPAPRFMKVTLDSATFEPKLALLRLFDKECAPYSLKAPLRLGHAHDMSVGGAAGLVGLVCGSKRTEATRLFMLYSIIENRVRGSFANSTSRDLHSFQSGTGAFDRKSGIVYDTSLRPTGIRINVGPLEHSAMAATPVGETYNMVRFDGRPIGTVVSYSMTSGMPRVVVGPDTGWPYPRSGTHLSVGAANGSGWIAVGSVGNGTGSRLLDNEIILTNVYTGETCRIAHARTKAKKGPWGYWGETHPQISADGRRVLFSSDWLGSDTVDTFVIDLRTPRQ